jgi:ubiquinone/menaquinone biosynthesis C-methylase UbiE
MNNIYFILFKIINIVSVFSSPIKYYYDNRIHNFGNIGFGGKIHSIVAPYATTIIDNTCYNSIDIRQKILTKYNNKFYENNNKLPLIIDLCCGTGTSTYENQLGIDTSKEMIERAKIIQTSKKTNTFFTIGNAENYGKPKQFNTATIMFAFHEMPNYAHNKIIKNAKRITTDDIIIIDISPNYKPSKIMLTGEPYLLNYKSTISDILKKHNFSYIEYIPNHVGFWYYNHNNCYEQYPFIFEI